MWLNMFLSAVVGIVCFLLAAVPATPFCYEFPMGAIGKIYASSMLVLLNSRMILGSEETETPSKGISVLRFGTAPANPGGSADNGDVAVDTRAGAAPSGGSEPEAG
jgi:hypothetical protein